MKYTIVERQQASRFDLGWENASVGDYVVLNENEMLQVNPDIEAAAAEMGGEVLSYQETLTKLNELRYGNDS